MQDEHAPAVDATGTQPSLVGVLRALTTLNERVGELASKDEHNQGLLEHSGNLEHLLKESVNHAKNLEGLWEKTEQDREALRAHASNLESRLDEECQARARLLEHIANIENDLKAWREEAKRAGEALAARDAELTRAREHAGNLEDRVEELQVEVKAQESAAYRYKLEVEAFKRPRSQPLTE